VTGNSGRLDIERDNERMTGDLIANRSMLEEHQ
jgi:hypothetical protein